MLFISNLEAKWKGGDEVHCAFVKGKTRSVVLIGGTMCTSLKSPPPELAKALGRLYIRVRIYMLHREMKDKDIRRKVTYGKNIELQQCAIKVNLQMKKPQQTLLHPSPVRFLSRNFQRLGAFIAAFPIEK